jgi:nifR3 family TIM-barrel protein
MTQSQPSFLIGNLPIHGDVILAPMVGYADSPFRRLAREMGSAMSYTEFVNAIDVVHHAKIVAERAHFKEDERPVALQIFDSEPQRMADAAAQIVLAYHPDILDINLGCSVRDVSGRGAGAGLLRSPEKVAQIFHLISTSLPIPVTAKIRLGWDESSLNYMEISQAIVENGGRMIVVHGRTRKQVFTGSVDLESIAQIKQAVAVPVIANGDIRTPADIERVLRFTGCDGVMIGRASLGYPWIFQRRAHASILLEETIKVIRRHLELMIEEYGAERGVILFRKHLSRYLKPYSVPRPAYEPMITATAEAELLHLLDSYLADSHSSETTG